MVAAAGPVGGRMPLKARKQRELGAHPEGVQPRSLTCAYMGGGRAAAHMVGNGLDGKCAWWLVARARTIVRYGMITDACDNGSMGFASPNRPQPCYLVAAPTGTRPDCMGSLVSGPRPPYALRTRACITPACPSLSPAAAASTSTWSPAGGPAPGVEV